MASLLTWPADHAPDWRRGFGSGSRSPHAIRTPHASARRVPSEPRTRVQGACHPNPARRHGACPVRTSHTSAGGLPSEPRTPARGVSRPNLARECEAVGARRATATVTTGPRCMSACGGRKRDRPLGRTAQNQTPDSRRGFGSDLHAPRARPRRSPDDSHQPPLPMAATNGSMSPYVTSPSPFMSALIHGQFGCDQALSPCNASTNRSMSA
jgi:hypothetical protein